MARLKTSNHWHEGLLSVLEEISGGLAVADNIHAIAHLILDLTIRHTNAGKGSFMLVNERQELTILSARGIDYGLARTYRIKIGEGIAGTVALQGRPVKVDDIDEDHRFSDIKKDRYRTRSFISCPIKSKNNILGVLNINDKKDGTPFDDYEFALVRIISNQAAVALKNALLFNEIKTKAVELEDANQKLIDSDIGKSEFLTRISHDLRTPLNSIKGSIYHLKNSKPINIGDQTEFIDIISKETEKLISIVEKQLEFLRFEDGVRIIKKTIISLEKAIDNILNSRLIKENINTKISKINIFYKNKSTGIVGDKVLVNQLLINLIEGIAFFLEPGQPLNIFVEDTEQVEVKFESASTLPVEVLANPTTFHDFYFSGSSEGAVKLYLALKAAESHGWRMIRENRDEGFRISLLIPKIARQKIEATINATLEMILEFTSELFDVDICSLMMNDDISGDMVINCARGIDDETIRRTRINRENRIAGWVAHEGAPMLVENFSTDPCFGGYEPASVSSTKSQLSLPLKIGAQIVGVLNLNSKKDGTPFTGRDLEAASIFVEGISSLIEGVYARPRSEEELTQLLASLDDLLTAERKYPKKNPRMVHFMEGIMKVLETSEEEPKFALYVSMIYDLGLMMIDQGVFGKKVKLSSMEESAFKLHPYTTLDLLDAIEPSKPVKDIILHHHERFDGTGYPDGLSGDQIPLVSRVLAIVDAFFAMIEERPYRKALSSEEALGEIKKEEGGRFDPEVVTAFEGVLADSKEYGF